MTKSETLNAIKGGLIVSCQALENEPLFSSEIMAKMALAAKLGGACAIRANTPADIKAIKNTVDLPIIGLYKKNYNDSEIYITPTMSEVSQLVDSGVDIIACDCTNRVRPNNILLDEFILSIQEMYPHILIMADISTEMEGVNAATLGVDMVSTTLSGYTPYSKQIKEPDYDLISNLAKKITIPVIAEGRIHSPTEAKEALQKGAFAVVVGGAITRPLEITKRFVDCINNN